MYIVIHPSLKNSFRTYPSAPKSFMPNAVNHCCQWYPAPRIIIVCVCAHYIFPFLKLLHKWNYSVFVCLAFLTLCLFEIHLCFSVSSYLVQNYLWVHIYILFCSFISWNTFCLLQFWTIIKLYSLDYCRPQSFIVFLKSCNIVLQCCTTS